jgi:hypothetical protein
MVIDKQYMHQLRSNHRYSGMRFTAELEQILLDRLGREPEPGEYSEQDLHEQARKIVMQYQSPEGRLQLLYGLDKVENELAYLKAKLGYLKRKIAYQLQDKAHSTEPFYIDIIYEEGSSHRL